ncbi:MAG: branched-chain amino acid aminotransferase [Alphaproteobacteria bacterium]|nr:branched-chain amino acid aminotransferase [Alphaproteobacteria bacterium]
MAQLANQRIAYHNGAYLPEDEVRVSFRDRGFKYGDAAFDTTRSFGGRIFKLPEHVERFYRSLRYLRLDPGLSPAQMIAVSEEVFARNRHLLGPDEDFWLSQRVSRGLDSGGPPTVIVECTPLPLKARAPLFRQGIEVVVPAVRRVSPSAVSPRSKMHNYINLILADFEAKAATPDAWAVLLDENGNLAEGQGSNIFLAREGRLYTPSGKYVLPGVSRQTVIDLAAAEGIAVVEGDIDLYDAAVADEAFLTSTSLCLCPIRAINGGKLGDGGVPGPLTKRLMAAYAKFVGFDFVGQYLKHLA